MRCARPGSRGVVSSLQDAITIVGGVIHGVSLWPMDSLLELFLTLYQEFIGSLVFTNLQTTLESIAYEDFRDPTEVMLNRMNGMFRMDLSELGELDLKGITWTLKSM